MPVAPRHASAIVLVATLAALAVGTPRGPLWDEDEPRFAAIARAMVESGDWVVPRYNGELAVDKPVLMHWCMAAAMTVLGPTEFAARLPSMLATLATALALLRAGSRWRDPATGVVAALAFVGCLLVGIEAHAATPDAILVALTTWATILAAEPFVAAAIRGPSSGPAPRLSAGRAALVGGLLGLAVVCKGPIGFVGPLAVLAPWAWWLACERRRAAGQPLAHTLLPAAGDTLRGLRPLVLTAAILACAAPWYVAVSLRTGGEWTRGFFFVHNVGRFLAPMERHGGSVFFHPVTMLVGFYPWSCFLPLAIVLAGWRLWRGTASAAMRPVLGLALVWLAVWVGGFSAAATKLPNYVLPAYAAAALLVALVGMEAATAARWPHPAWLASGVGWLAFGGAAAAATILAAARFGIPGAEPAALVGGMPIAGAIACAWLARRDHRAAVAAFTLTGLLFTSLAVGPAASRIARANALPDLVRRAQTRAGATDPLGTYMLSSPNVVFYAAGHVSQFSADRTRELGDFLATHDRGVVLVPEDRLGDVASAVPAGVAVIDRARPLFRGHDVLAVVAAEPRPATSTARTAAASERTR